MSWSAVETLARKLSLATTDRVALLGALRAERARRHPDSNGGGFNSPEEEALWHELNNAIDFLSNQGTSSAAELVPVSELAKQLAQIAQASKPALDQQQAAAISMARERSSRRLFLPRVGSGVFAAISGALFSFGGGLVGHPILGPLARTDTFYIVWGILLLYSSALFVLTWVTEQRAASRLEFWSSDEGLRELARLLTVGREAPIDFRLSQVANIIQGRRRFTLLFNDIGVDRQSAAMIAEIQIARMIEAGVVERGPTPTLDPAYRFIEPSEQ